MKHKTSSYALAIIALLLVCPIKGAAQNYKGAPQDDSNPVQIVALDECDPESFNKDPPSVAHKPQPRSGSRLLQEYRPGAPGIHYHIAGPFQTGRQRHPGPNWDFEPDELQVKKGSQIIVTNQGGEPHTFTEVKQFGGGFIPPLNNGQPTVL